MGHPGLAETAVHRQGLLGIAGRGRTSRDAGLQRLCPQICAKSRTDKTGQACREPDKFKLIRATQPSEPCRRQALSRFIINTAAFSNESALHRNRAAGTGWLRSSRGLLAVLILE